MGSNKQKDKVIQLRVENRLSYREIQKRTGVARSTLNLWLQSYPLSPEEKTAKSRENWGEGGHNKKSHGPPSKFWEAVDPDDVESQRKANISEAAVFFRLTLHGFHPYGSVFDGDKADWIVETPDHKKIWRIQVRSTFLKKQGLPRISLRKARSGRFNPEEFDFLVGYDLYSDTAYIFSEKEISNLKASVSVKNSAAERWDKML